MTNKIIIDPQDLLACPHCSSEFVLRDALTNQLIERYESEYESMLQEEKLRLHDRATSDAEKLAASKFEDQIADLKDSLEQSKADTKKAKQKIELAKQKATEAASAEALEQAEVLRADIAAKDEKLSSFRNSELQLRKEKVALEEKQKDFELRLQREVDTQRQQIQEASANDYQFREAEWRKKIDDAQKANEDLKRKLEQGSQQLQGEVLELEIEGLLQGAFPYDAVEPVKKGSRGADVIQTVRQRSGAICGKIVWESKRAENWSNKWIPKLKDDQQDVGGELAVLVSTAFPAGVEEPMVIQDGVWLVRPELVRPMAEALRTVLLESSRQKAIAAGKGEIMETIFNYITSPQFAQRVRAVVDAQEQMRDDLDKEKNAMQRLWKKREGQMERIANNMLAMCGDLQGISGEALPELEGIAEMPLLEVVT